MSPSGRLRSRPPGQSIACAETLAHAERGHLETAYDGMVRMLGLSAGYRGERLTMAALVEEDKPLRPYLSGPRA